MLVELVSPDHVHHDLLPLLLALTAAFLFALGSHIQNLGLPHIGARQGAMVSITASAGMFWLLSPFLMTWSYWLHPSMLIFVLVGLFRPALSASLAVTGMRYLGPTLSSTLASTSPLFGSALGVLWLGEVITGPLALGTLGIVVSIVLLSRRKSGVDLKTDWPTWALLLPIGAAALRSLGHVLSKVGMQDIPDPYFAGLVGFTVSAIVMNGVNIVRGRAPRAADGTHDRAQRGPAPNGPIDWSSPGPRWFAAAGLCFGTAIVALNSALLLGDVVVVVPIVAASPIFTLLLSIIVFRKEKLTPKVVLAVCIVVPSVAVIASG